MKSIEGVRQIEFCDEDEFLMNVYIHNIIEHNNEINPVTGNPSNFIEIVIEGKDEYCSSIDYAIRSCNISHLYIIDEHSNIDYQYADYIKFMFLQKRDPDSVIAIYMEQDTTVVRNKIVTNIYNLPREIPGDIIYSMFKEIGVNRLHVSGNFTIFSFLADPMEDTNAICRQIRKSIHDLEKVIDNRIESLVSVKENVDVTDEYLRQQQEFFRPHLIADDLLVVPSNIEETPSDIKYNHKIILDANSSYGDGRHPSTQLLIKWMKNNLNPDQSFLDIGTGNGILALYAHELGCNRIGCCDIDVHAFPSVIRNCKLNHISDLNAFEFHNGTKSYSDCKYDVIAVNFTYNLLWKELCNIINWMDDTHSTLLISGVHVSVIRFVCETLSKRSVDIIDIEHMDEWALIHCKLK